MDMSGKAGGGGELDEAQLAAVGGRTVSRSVVAESWLAGAKLVDFDGDVGEWVYDLCSATVGDLGSVPENDAAV